MSDEPAPPAGRSKRMEVATLLTVVGLLLTFVFSALGEWHGAQEQKEQRITQQIDLITALDANAGATEKAITETGLDYCGYSKEKAYYAAEGELLAALGYYEYLAWLYNHERLTVGRDHFAFRMINGWRFAQRYAKHFDKRNFDEDFRELRRFVSDSRVKPRERCG